MSDNKKIIIYAIGGLAFAYVVYKTVEKQNKYQNFKKELKPTQRQVKDLNFEYVKPMFIQIGDTNDEVLRLKKLINYFYGSDLVEVDDFYDEKLLKVVQDLFKQTPALIDSKSGQFCVNFIDVTEYIVKKSQGSDTSNIKFIPIPKDEKCEFVSKGDRGYKVVALQKIINDITNNETLKVNGKYSANMKNVVSEIFEGTNILNYDDANLGVCYRYINTLNTMLKTIDENLKESETEKTE